MGKARIVGGGEDGQYTIEVLHNRARIDSEIETLNARIAELDAEIAEVEADLAEAEEARRLAAVAIDTIVDATPEGEIPDVEAELIELARAGAEVQKIEAQLGILLARRLALRKRREALQAIPSEVLRVVWCADVTEDLTGDVATVELPGESSQRIIVRPGYADGAAYSASRDGQLFHREGQSPEQVYFNAAILPGWQRHMPMYRIARITALDTGAHTASIDLIDEVSSAQSLPINDRLQYANVPIEYMECDSAAFEVNDRVLVEFADRTWNSPKIIGFEKEPRGCVPEYIVLRSRNYHRTETRQVTRWLPDGTSEPYVTGVVGQGIVSTDRALGTVEMVTSTPTGYTRDSNQPLYFTYWTTVLRWSDAAFYKDEVGGEVSVIGGIRPDGWEADHEVAIFRPTPTNHNVRFGTFGIDEGLERTVEVAFDGYQVPGNFTNTDTDQISEQFGYDRIYRFAVSGLAYWHCGINSSGTLTSDTYQAPDPCGDPFGGSRLRFVGSYTLEIVGEEVGDLLAISQDEIPEEFTIRGVRYIRKDMGWTVDPGNTRYRLATFVYAREDVSAGAVPYAAGFWAE